MFKLIQKVRYYFKVRKLKNELKLLMHERGCYHYAMQFDDLNQGQIDEINRKLSGIELHKRILEGQILSYE